jgi:hypothetical protein
MKRNLIKTGALALSIIAIAGSAYAVTQTVTANIAFDTAITITPVNDIDFGTVEALSATTYVINTADTVSVSAGTGQLLGGTPASGELTIIGSTTQLIDITANNYVANAGVTPSAATCAYNGGAAAACTSLTGVAAPGAGKTLLLGVTAAADGTQAANSTAAPTFDIVVAYN